MLYEFYLYKEYYNKISLWWINQIVAANTHIVGMQYLIFTSFHVITRDKILKSVSDPLSLTTIRPTILTISFAILCLKACLSPTSLT